MNLPVKVAVIGASGYSGQELLRLLLQHSAVDLVAVTSRAEAGKEVAEVLPRFAGLPKVKGLCFTAPDVADLVALGVEVVFLALPHGVSLSYAGDLLAAGLRVIDLSADFRLDSAEVYAEYYGQEHPCPELLKESVYGLPEWNRERIAGARLVAAPGCYPTSILLPLLPLVQAGLIELEGIVANSMSGASGGGKTTTLPWLFCEVSESLRAYGIGKHRHLGEVEEQLGLMAGREVAISFQPHLVPTKRGIATTINAKASEKLVSLEQLGECFEAAYGQEALVRLRGAGVCPDTKDVVQTAFIDMGWHWDQRTGRVVLCSAEDNLSKGASSQAVQCLEIWAGVEKDGELLRV